MENSVDGPSVGANAKSEDRPRVGVLDEIRDFWDADAPTYDNSPGHHPTSPAVMAAWTAALERLLPAGSARVLDVGAGTGFLSLIAARLGHKVTAVDLSTQMLDKLQASARREGLEIEVVVSPADALPERFSPAFDAAFGTGFDTEFDAVMERHLLWTLPDPQEALASWRRVAPDGKLLLVESLWGRVDPIEMARERVSHRLHKLRGHPPDHHGSYSDAVRQSLPLGTGTSPSKLVEMVSRAGWRVPRLVRLRDVEWAERSNLPMLERLVGVSPRFVVVAS